VIIGATGSKAGFIAPGLGMAFAAAVGASIYLGTEVSALTDESAGRISVETSHTPNATGGAVHRYFAFNHGSCHRSPP
jgi:hypothetical protein